MSRRGKDTEQEKKKGTETKDEWRMNEWEEETFYFNWDKVTRNWKTLKERKRQEMDLCPVSARDKEGEIRTDKQSKSKRNTWLDKINGWRKWKTWIRNRNKEDKKTIKKNQNKNRSELLTRNFQSDLKVLNFLYKARFLPGLKNALPSWIVYSIWFLTGWKEPSTRNFLKNYIKMNVSCGYWYNFTFVQLFQILWLLLPVVHSGGHRNLTLAMMVPCFATHCTE